MKIAYLTGEYPRATDTFIQREVDGLRKAGLDVLTCSIRETSRDHHVGEEQKVEAAGTFHILKRALNPVKTISAQAKLIMQSPKRWLAALGLAVKTSPAGLKAFAYQLVYFCEAAVLAHYMQKKGVDHLHNHIAKSSCTVAMLASALSDIPYSFTLHGPDIFFEPKHWRLDEKIKRARFVSCISHFCRSQAMAFSAAEHWNKLHIVHCGIDPERYLPKSAPSPMRNLLFVGRLTAVKGLPLLLEAMQMAQSQQLTLSIVGDGEDRTSLEAAVHRLGLSKRVTFLGYRSQGEVADLLADCDALVLPSFAEGVPVVLMEAMAAGLPVISSKIAGIPELVDDGRTGLLTAPGDISALTEAIDSLASDKNKAYEMGIAGRQTVVAEFHAQIEARRLATLFEGYKQGKTLLNRPEPKGTADVT